MSYFADSLVHLTSLDLENTRLALKRQSSHQVSILNQSGTHSEDWTAQEKLQKSFPEFHWLLNFGLHPWWAQTLKSPEEELQKLESRLANCDGIGEIGLDYWKAQEDKQRMIQKSIFARQLEIAQEHDKPIILHMVRSHHEGQSMLKSIGRKGFNGIIHGFHGNTHTAKFYLDLGLHISLGPHSLRDIRQDLFQYIPKDRLLIESDCPQAGRADTVLTIAQEIARFRTGTPESLAELSTKNLCKLYEKSPRLP